MAETKRVSDQYKITAPSIIIDGNLTVMGSTTSVETINSSIKDNTIILNDGEIGAGVTAGSAGLEIERGSLDNTRLLFNESLDVWEFTIGGNFAIVRGGTPIHNNDLVTKKYVDDGVSALQPKGPQWAVQVNDNGSFEGFPGLIYDGNELLIDNLVIAGNQITNSVTNQDLILSANGIGQIALKAPIKLDYEITNPNFQASTNIVYAKTPSTAGSGLFFTNSTTSDELVSRKKAILFGLIF